MHNIPDFLRITPEMQEHFAKGGMIKRADGHYSKRGLWDNIRANKGSGKKPTAAMLKQERKIKSSMQSGGSLYMKYKSGGTISHTTKGPGANYRPTKSGAGMTAKGVAAYRRANPGSKLQTAVTGSVKLIHDSTVASALSPVPDGLKSSTSGSTKGSSLSDNARFVPSSKNMIGTGSPQ